MATLLVATPDPALKQAWARLLVAAALSLAVHLALLLGIPVNPTGGVPFVTSIINARLESATSETPAEAVVDPPSPNATPDAAPDKSTVVDPLADPAVGKKPEPKPEPKLALAALPATPSAGIEVPLIRDPTYYPANQLDVYPQALNVIKPDCSEPAVIDRVIGGLRLLVLINEFGIVDDVSVVEAPPAGYNFERAWVAAFRAGRFSPGQRQGRAVKSRAVLTVKFECYLNHETNAR